MSAVPGEVNRMNIADFQEQGYLQELNRQFLHPLGLALEVVTDGDGEVTAFGGVWDYRDDPEGICFAGGLDNEKAAMVLAEQTAKHELRKQQLGWVIQPLEE